MGIDCSFYLPNPKTGKLEIDPDSIWYNGNNKDEFGNVLETPENMVSYSYLNEIDYDSVPELAYLGFNRPNTTHNLNRMAMAGDNPCYQVLWHPEEMKEERFTCEELLTYLELYHKELLEKPDYFKQFDAPNGWGTYPSMVEFIEGLIGVCRLYPTAIYVPSV